MTVYFELTGILGKQHLFCKLKEKKLLNFKRVFIKKSNLKKSN
jgi:hypothetical protein